MAKNSYGMAEAKAKLSEVVARAQKHGPQRITMNGKAAAVVVSAEEWGARTGGGQNAADFFMQSPFRRYRVPIERFNGKLRNLDS